MLKNYRPVSNLSFLSTVIEKVIYIRILEHILDNDIFIVFSLLIGQATVVRPLYFVCTMILSQPLEKAMDHFEFFWICPLLLTR